MNGSYDFDHDGYITKEEVKLVLSHVPLEKEGGTTIDIGKDALNVTQNEIKENFDIRAESQEELSLLAEKCFKKKLTLSCEDFAYIIDYVDSAMFLCLLSLLRVHFPSLLEFRRYDLTQKDGKSALLSRPTSRKLAHSKLLAKFAPVSELFKTSIIRSSSFDSFSNITSKTNVKEEVKSKFAKGSDSPQVSAVRLSNAKQDSVDVTVSPSHYLDKEDRISPSLFCQCGRQISDFNILQCEACLNVDRILKCEGYLFVKSEKGVKIEKFWYVVEKRVIYRYGAKTDKTYKRMRSLAGCFFKEEPTERFEDRTLAYSFTIWFSNSLKTRYLCQSKEEYDHWCEVIKASIGYSNFNSYYEMKVINNYIIGSFR